MSWTYVVLYYSLLYYYILALPMLPLFSPFLGFIYPKCFLSYTSVPLA